MKDGFIDDLKEEGTHADTSTGSCSRTCEDEAALKTLRIALVVLFASVIGDGDQEGENEGSKISLGLKVASNSLNGVKEVSNNLIRYFRGGHCVQKRFQHGRIQRTEVSNQINRSLLNCSRKLNKWSKYLLTLFLLCFFQWFLIRRSVRSASLFRLGLLRFFRHRSPKEGHKCRLKLVESVTERRIDKSEARTERIHDTQDEL